MTEVAFEKALKNLEAAVERLESGELPLEEALSCFEEGVRSAQLCRKSLQDVEARVELLLKEKDGSFTLTPMATDEG
ncbi:Exodeoxyribonuclease VII small subunit [Geoalkalibacter ferrihydriticus]|uniref:Exodeoxyribonuclease 7 small subunit n=2 Tax=Geoalkalibacter ferrihydriticus TaxID=392333 RepID=A0A0C2HUE8_9BACT|nr:exodeoxyribonuclease VII small subunit [Geoalkalibacter ferrihydriticus]KIH76457.1 exodeoxyribonuclease VII small subunit [Geoalkalibacter ferrihydriticus DSM 17813]SDL96117.1 Exodeoxyribonuclease VII small subunit [Geoalkalibacter ferrihydriticus]